MNEPTFTVEEASRWLTCPQPLPMKLLQKLGKDCSMVCRIRGLTPFKRPTPTQRWPYENAYPVAIIREVFEANPETAPHIPRGAE